MSHLNSRREARRQKNVGVSPSCESLEKREVLSAAGLTGFGGMPAWGGPKGDAADFAHAGGKAPGANTFHFDHTTADKTGTPPAGFNPGGPMIGSPGKGGPGGPDHGTLPAAVSAAQKQLETDTKAALGDPPKAPSAASLQQLQTDMKAVHDGTLTGTAATTQLQADHDAILASQGATAAQITAIDADQAALDAAFKAAFPNAPTPPAGFDPGGPGHF